MPAPMHHRRPLPWWLRLLYVAIGAFVVAVGLELFLVPNRLIDGGVTGVSILAAYLTGWPLGAFLFALNLPFLYFGYVQIGRTFALTTCLAVALLSGFTTLLIPVPPVTTDILLVSVFGGVAVGAGTGLVIRHGGSMDGSESVALATSRATGFTVGEIILAINLVIFSVAGFILGWDRAFYSMLAYFAAFRTIDLVVQGIDESRGVFIVSPKAEEISQAIQARLGRGVTHLVGRGGYSEAALEVLYTVVTRLELAKLKGIVTDLDEDAFFAIHPVAEATSASWRKHNIH